MHHDIVILAAGKGSRMQSARSKVLHPLAGKALVHHVLDTASSFSEARLHLIVGHQGQQLIDHCQAYQANIVWQDNPQGTGDALRRVVPFLADAGYTLTLYGDVPLIQRQTLLQMMAEADPQTLVLLTVTLADPTGYGRIVRDSQGHVRAIVEHKDASADQQQIQEVNTGILLAPNSALVGWLAKLNNQNAQGEYYLTDIIAMAAADGLRIATVQPQEAAEVAGVNDRVQLSALERVYQQQQAQRLMRQGLTLQDPGRFDLRGQLEMGLDCSIDINCVIEGHVVLGDNVHIGPHCHLKDCRIGDNSQVKSHSLIDGAQIDHDCEIGPFARLRPGTLLAQHAKIGNFVETKKARIGVGSKVNHLSYIGDTEMGAQVNIGAGTITCNYDGVNKSLTQIEDGVFVGSNTSLVAPVQIGAGATIAAGSTITKTVAPQQLAVARARQSNLDGWQRPRKASKPDHN